MGERDKENVNAMELPLDLVLQVIPSLFHCHCLGFFVSGCAVLSEYFKSGIICGVVMQYLSIAR